MLSSRNEREEKKRDVEERQMRVYLKCFCGVVLLFCLPVLLLIDARISISVSDFELAEKRAKSKKSSQGAYCLTLQSVYDTGNTGSKFI